MISNTTCMICNRLFDHSDTCPHCKKHLQKLIEQGKVPRGVDICNWEAMIVKMRDMRRHGCLESDVQRTMQERCMQLHQIWLKEQHRTGPHQYTTQEIEDELPPNLN